MGEEMIINMQDNKQWHKHFCLFPRVVNNTWVWLDYVQRSEVFTGYALDGCDDGGYKWEYKLLVAKAPQAK